LGMNHLFLGPNATGASKARIEQPFPFGRGNLSQRFDIMTNFEKITAQLTSINNLVKPVADTTSSQTFEPRLKRHVLKLIKGQVISQRLPMSRYDIGKSTNRSMALKGVPNKRGNLATKRHKVLRFCALLWLSLNRLLDGLCGYGPQHRFWKSQIQNF